MLGSWLCVNGDLLPGRVFLTTKHICFACDVLSSGASKVTIPVYTVRSLTKQTTDMESGGSVVIAFDSQILSPASSSDAADDVRKWIDFGSFFCRRNYAILLRMIRESELLSISSHPLSLYLSIYLSIYRVCRPSCCATCGRDRASSKVWCKLQGPLEIHQSN